MVVTILPIGAFSSSIEYYNAQDSIYPNFDKIINNKKLNSYLSNPDTLNLQIVYGWGRDLGLKNPRAGLWIADTLLKLATIQKDHRAIISAHSLFAQMYQQQADIYNSIKSFKEAIRYGETNIDNSLHPNFDKLGSNYLYLGDLYYDIGDKKNAKIYYKKGWDIFSKITDNMIKDQDSINAKYYRDYTSYSWDKLYSQLKMGLILTESEKSYDTGVNLLEEVLRAKVTRDAILKIEAAFYLAKAYYSKNDTLYLSYLNESYTSAKRAILYDLISKIGYFKITSSLNRYNKDGDKILMLDTITTNEVMNALSFTNNTQIKHKVYKLLSKYHKPFNTKLSLDYLDSAYYYQEISMDSENQMKIGKIQSDLEYQETLSLSNAEKELAKQNLYYTLIILLILSILLVLLIFFLFQRNRLHKELEIKNQKISNQNTRLAELINSREQLLGIIGHDLRNPIKGFRLNTNNMIKSAKDNPLQDELIEIEKQALEIENLLNNLLDYAEANLNIPLMKDEHIDLEELVDSIEHLYHHLIVNKKITIQKDFKVKSIKSNLFILTNVIANTLSNAIKFSYEDKPIKISTYTEDSFVIIKVEDSGIGIDADNLDKIRNQIKPKVQNAINAPTGNGFGLITAINQLEKIDGNLFIESEVNIGTTILIYLNDD